MVPDGFLKLIATRMAEQGLSLRAVAKLAGMSPAFLSRILSGERGLPSNEDLLELAKALGIRPPALLLIEAGRLPTRGVALSEADARTVAQAAQDLIMRQRRKRRGTQS